MPIRMVRLFSSQKACGSAKVIVGKSMNENLQSSQATLIIDKGLGGLVAAKLKEPEHHDLHVISLYSPAWAADVELTNWMNRRVSPNCSGYEVIAGRT